MLTFGKLRAQSELVTTWTACRYAPMRNTHPFYAGYGILAQTDRRRVTTPLPTAQQYYGYSSDFPAEKVAAFAPLPPQTVLDFITCEKEIEGKSMAAFVAAMQVALAPQVPGCSKLDVRGA